MSDFARRVAALTGVAEEALQPLAAESLRSHAGAGREWRDGSQEWHVVRPEAAMLRAIAAAGLPCPAVEGEHENMLLLEHVDNDAVFSVKAWADIGAALARLHARCGESYGWPVDYALGTVKLDNRERRDWPGFWAEQRLIATARFWIGLARAGGAAIGAADDLSRRARARAAGDL